jgi:signal transduction histidine kinase
VFGIEPTSRQQERTHPFHLSVGRALLLATAVGVVYFLTAYFSLGLLVEPDGVAAFWPAAGVSSGILIALGPQARWPVAAGVIGATLAANLMGDRDVYASAVFAIANAAEAIITAGLVAHHFRGGFKFDRVHQVLGFLVAAIAGTAASGLIGAVGYRLFHSPTVPMLIIWWHWFASDALGIIAVAPLIIKIGVVLRDPPGLWRAIEGIAALVFLAAMTGIVLSLPEEPWKTVLPTAMLFPALLWLAARCRPVFGAAGAFIVSFAVVWTTTFGVGHFGDPRFSAFDRLQQAQAIILVVTIGTYVLSALFAERRVNAALLASSNTLLQRERDSKLLNIEAALAWIAHELSQPMTGISTNSGAALRFLEMAPPDERRAKAALGRITDQTARLGEILDGVRSFFHGARTASIAIDVNELILRALDSFREELIQHSVVVRPELTLNLPIVEGNRSQLLQVISNFVRNALEAMAATKNRPRELRLRTEPHGDDAVAITVEDSGPGIDPAQLDKVFGVFFSTKVHGMGLGLAICRLIVERHGGRVTASSDGKNGARFNVILPASSPKQAADQAA